MTQHNLNTYGIEQPLTDLEIINTPGPKERKTKRKKQYAKNKKRR